LLENQLKAAETLFVDDALINVEGAEAAGLKGLFLRPGYDPAGFSVVSPAGLFTSSKSMYSPMVFFGHGRLRLFWLRFTLRAMTIGVLLAPLHIPELLAHMTGRPEDRRKKLKTNLYKRYNTIPRKNISDNGIHNKTIIINNKAKLLQRLIKGLLRGVKEVVIS